MRIGQTTAMSNAFCSIQLFPIGTGLPNSSRTALAVEDTGFHIAIVPSHSGISDGGVKTLEIIPNGKAIANAEEVFAVSTWPGKGCEAANIGLARYAGVAGWSWQSFCKTHYAGEKEAGGVANFVRCHAGVCLLLASIKKLGVKVEVADEVGFWEHRDRKRLAQDRKMRLF